MQLPALDRYQPSQRRALHIAFGVASCSPAIALAMLYLAGAAYASAAGTWPRPGDEHLVSGAIMQQAGYFGAWLALLATLVAPVVTIPVALMLANQSERPKHPFDWVFCAIPLFAARGFFPESWLIFGLAAFFAPLGFAWRRLPIWAARLVGVNALGSLWLSLQIARDPSGLIAWLAG
ncbi:MAG: hypothetical protein HC822_20010 [Oscillochloris sp.]|nr:hypothetical protein [Oscillochloris sp.]